MNRETAQREVGSENYFKRGGHRNPIRGGGCEEVGKEHPNLKQKRRPGGRKELATVMEARRAGVWEPKGRRG